MNANEQREVYCQMELAMLGPDEVILVPEDDDLSLATSRSARRMTNKYLQALAQMCRLDGDVATANSQNHKLQNDCKLIQAAAEQIHVDLIEARAQNEALQREVTQRKALMIQMSIEVDRLRASNRRLNRALDRDE